MKNMKIVTKSTTFPISCICYPNDEETLISALEKLQSNMPYVEYCYIFHFGENGDKNHYHLLMRSNADKGFQNIDKILRYFYQPCKEDVYIKDGNGNHILKYKEGEEVCYIAQRHFIVTNSLGDWYDYVLHDEEYLEVKNNGKK